MDDEARLEAAWQALEEQGGERALELAEELSDEQSGVWVLRATAWLDLERHREAAAACERAAELDGADDLDVLWVRGELALAQWNIADAGRSYERILAQGREPAALERLALVRDLEGRFRESDGLLREAQRLDREAYALPPRLTEAQLDEVIAEATAALPEEFQGVLDEVPVVVEPMPPLELGRLGEQAEVPPDVLGLFVGAALTEGAVEDPVANVPRIYLFQRNIERSCGDHAELVEQVRVTLYHELGHYLGFDEQGVEDLGLG